MMVARVLKTNGQSSLEQRGFAALKAAVGSSELETLIAQVEEAIRTADRTAEQQQVRSLEPGVADAKACRDEAENLVFTANRLRTLLHRLEARHQHVCAEECRQAWRSERFEPLKQERDSLAAELIELGKLYQQCVTQGVDLFSRISLNNEAIKQLHRDQEMEEWLLSAELRARNLDEFSASQPSVLDSIHLFVWDTGEQVWPLPQPSLGAAMAAMMTVGHDPAYSADWASANERRVAAIRAEQQRLADYYETAKREQEERENAEEKQGFMAQQQRQS
jgi:hypothetical protein